MRYPCGHEHRLLPGPRPAPVVPSGIETEPARAAARRIILDVSGVIRWLGPPVGIVRCEHALARYAVEKRPDIVLCVFDPSVDRFYRVNPAWAGRLLGWDHAFDAVAFRARAAGRPLARLRPSRYSLTMALERLRLGSGPALDRAIDGLQRALWRPRRLPYPFADKQGRRNRIAPLSWALGQPLDLGPGDTILSVGSDWYFKPADRIGPLKRRHGFRYAVMCYDLIPILFPSFFPEPDLELFRRHWSSMMGVADLVLVNARRTESDLRRYCAGLGIEPPSLAVAPLGCERISAGPGVALPAGLQEGKFILLVATIEPRKGHAMLLDIWQQLLAEGLPQRLGFKLVFVGRPGWHVDDLLARIADGAAFAGTVLHLSGLHDRVVARLYEAAAFCVLPSLYEGFGLPLVEAFSRGKTVIASTGGSLPEVAGEFAPCLAPRDAGAWRQLIARWMEDETLRRGYEDRIRRSFRAASWDDAAARIFDAVGQLS